MTMSPQKRSEPHLVLIVTSDVSLVFFRGQIRHLRQAGFAVTCISSPGPRQQIPLEEGAQVISLEMKRGISPWRDLRSLLRLTRLLRQLRPDIVNAGTPKAGLLGALAATLARVPHRVYTMHGLRLETARGLPRRLLYCMEWIACHCVHRVRAVSPSLRARAIQLKLIAPSQIYVLGAGTANGVDLQRFQPTPECHRTAAQLRCELVIASDAPVVGFVGRITRDKGIGELAAVYRQLRPRFPALRLLLIGTFEACCAADEAFRQTCLHDPNIITVHEVADLAPYYLLMDILLLPTYREGFPNVPVEAQAMGVPVITTNATGARDAVQDGLTGILVPVRDAAAMAAAAASLLADPEGRKRMGAAGQAWVREHFAAPALWSLIADDFTAMLTATGNREDPASSTTGAEMQRAKSLYRRFGKRLLDAGASAALLLAFAPLLLATALAIRLALGSPVLFRQQRPGQRGRPFTLVKFRTMKHALNAVGEPLPDAQRLTTLGRFLRSTSLDELPELVNVLKGEMSLVGPRPLLMEYLRLYTPAQQRRHDVPPGITGWAQINGRNAIGWQQRLELDADYVTRQSFTLDLRILWRTVAQVLRRTGISSQGHDTMPKFQGTEHG